MTNEQRLELARLGGLAREWGNGGEFSFSPYKSNTVISIADEGNQYSKREMQGYYLTAKILDPMPRQLEMEFDKLFFKCVHSVLKKRGSTTARLSQIITEERKNLGLTNEQ